MRWILFSLLAVLAATCGQKGPLYLPDEPARQAARQAACPSAGWLDEAPCTSQPGDGSTDRGSARASQLQVRG